MLLALGAVSHALALPAECAEEVAVICSYTSVRSGFLQGCAMKSGAWLQAKGAAWFVTLLFCAVQRRPALSVKCAAALTSPVGI